MRWLGLAALAVGWVVSRAWLLWLLHHSQEWVTGDIGYYFLSVRGLDDTGFAHTLVEYPVPGVLALAVPYAVASAIGDPGQYQNALLGLGLLTDAVFAVLLAWRGRRGSLLPVLVWVLGVPLLGSTSLARFDLLPGVLVGVAVLLLPARPALAALLASLATGVKLWPALVLPSVLAVARRRLRVVGVVGAAGLALVSVTVALGGRGRLFTPLGYQTDRGLQIESVPATPAMLGWAFSRGRWDVAYAASRSFEVTGPGVSALEALSTLAVVLLALGLLAACARVAVLARAGHRLDVASGVWLALASVAGAVVTGKVLSPQYLLWLLPVAAAGLVVADSRALRTWSAGLLVAAALTQVFFPYGFADVVAFRHLPVYVGALALRNLALCVLTGYAGWRAYAGLRSAGQRGRAPAVPAREDGPTHRTAGVRPLRARLGG